MASTAQAGAEQTAESPQSQGEQPGGGVLNDLARAALTGNPLAVRQFLGAITPLVCKVCRGVMGRQDPDLEDCIQESLVDVVRALPRFRYECDVTHYVTKITVRKAIAARQRSRKESKRIAPIEAGDLPQLSVSADDGTDSRADLLRNLLDDLRKEQANALRLRLMLGHSIGEIAGITGVSQNTVKNRLRLGKIQLRRWLKRMGESRSANR
jgi:RNA polymerase sigma-70 factor (ECF subfamily)